MSWRDWLLPTGKNRRTDLGEGRQIRHACITRPICIPVPYGSIAYALGGATQIDAILEVSAESEKPMAAILFTAGLLEGEKVACEVNDRFVEAGLPVFPTFGRAAHAVSRLISYRENQET